MADKLIFPIGFDLEKAVNEAGQQWDKKYAKKLEDYMAKRPVHVKLDFEKLEDVKKRLAQLKIEPVTPETKAAIKELARELQVLAKALEQVQKYSRNPTKGAVDASKVQLNEERAKAQAALAAQRAAKAEDNLASARLKAARAANVGTSATRSANKAYQEQTSYLQRLTQRMAAYWSIRQVGNFLTSVRGVTAEFELQRVSLGAIIQDQSRANQLFQEIKAFALKSPVKILDLTKYTKQLAAYKIETEDLFETTKRLTDISVGLGVSMDRIVLMFGQIRATGYLRASEVRQATEAGIPLVEELAKKIQKANGELVTAADVMNMISKRQISFEQVKEVFDDMTSAGGIFYNMQEKQGNTLYGMWQKLGDAAAVMYEEIGNTEWVNAGMKRTIEWLTKLMKSWKDVGAVIAGVGVAMTGMWVKNTISAWQGPIDAARIAANKRYIAASAEYQAALKAERAALFNVTMEEYKALAAKTASAEASMAAARAELIAARNTTIWTKAVNRLKTALSRNWLTMLIGLVVMIGYKLHDVLSRTDEVGKRMRELDSDARSGLEQSILSFERLAKTITEASDGSRQQREALDELQRTYGKMIPVQDLTIERLKAMKGNYEQLTYAIKEYAAEQLQINKTNALIEMQGDKLKKLNKEIEEIGQGALFHYMREGESDWTSIELSAEDVKKVKAALEELSKDTSLSFGEAMKGAFESVAGLNVRFADLSSISRYYTPFQRLYQTIHDTYSRIEEESELTRSALNADLLGYAKDFEKFKERLKNISIPEAVGTFAFDKAKMEAERKEYVDFLKQIFESENIEFDESKFLIGTGGVVNWKAVEAEMKKGGGKTIEVAHRLVMRLRGEWEKSFPTEAFERSMRDELTGLTEQMGGNMDRMRRYLAQGGDDLNSYRKKLKDWIKDGKESIQQSVLLTENYDKGIGVGIIAPQEIEKERKSIKETQEDVTILEALLKRLPELLSGGGGGRGDGRVETLEKINRALREMYGQYGKLEKRVGRSRATEEAERVYKQELDYLRELAKDNGLELDLSMPKTIKDLNRMQTQIWNALNRIQTQVARRAMIDVGKVMDSDWMDANMQEIDAKLKELADRISRTKTAKEFYDKILGQTGDASLALNLTTSIYSEDGQDLKKQAADQVRSIFSEWKIEMPLGIVDKSDNIDYKALREFAKEAQKTKAIGEGVANELIKIAENGEKELSRVAQEGAKLLLSYDEIAQKRVNIEQEASNKIRMLREAEALYLASQASKDSKTDFSNRTNNAIEAIEADRDLKLLKLKDQYLRFFSAIHSLTSKEAKKLRTEIRQALFKAFQSGAIGADQLKRELKAVDEQFQKLINDSGAAMTYLKNGFDGVIQRVRDTADELQAVASEISKMKSTDQVTEGQKSFINNVLGKFGDNSTGKNFSELFSKTNGNLKQMGGLLSNISGKMGGMASSASGALAIIDMIIKNVAATIDGIAQIRDQLNEMRSESNQLGGGFWDAFEYLENFNKYAASGWEKLKSGNIPGALADTASSIISIFGTSINQRVKRANKEIERQQKILDNLSYSYGRLEKAAENALAADYIDNYNQQLENLQAQQAAYMKQYEAEMSKGKKADDAKAQEFLDKARDIGDQIADMKNNLAAQILGSDIGSMARDFASAWLEAYKEFGNTTDAMSKKFKEMIEEMVANSVIAQVMKKALEPTFDLINGMESEDFYDEAFWRQVADEAERGAEAGAHGAEVVAKMLEKSGINLREIGSEYTGIAKDIAGATSEEINTLAGYVNTSLYYTSHLPVISQNVAAVYQLMLQGRGSAIPDTGVTGWTDWQQQAMENYNAIARNTADTVVRCERAAVACEAMAEKMSSAFHTKGATRGFNVFLNS